MRHPLRLKERAKMTQTLVDSITVEIEARPDLWKTQPGAGPRRQSAAKRIPEFGLD
jgi:hypothetical protein